MNTLREGIHEYVALRRNLGFKMRDTGAHLLDFATFMEDRHAPYVTLQLALTWAQQPKGASPAWWGQRMSAIRGFARHRSAVDERTQVPPTSLFPYRTRRTRPYLYSSDEIGRLLDAALHLHSHDELWRWTFHCFLGLLIVTGLRFAEAQNLKLDDVDVKTGVLTIRNTKFGKSRLIPLHASTTSALRRYLARRGRYWEGTEVSPYVFVGRSGKQLWATQIRIAFRKVSKIVGLRAPQDTHGPRLHDFRHRFAMETLIRWYQSGQDPEQRLPVLSAYLGHVSYQCTYWYLSNSPELMQQAMRRLARRWGDKS